jgi:hypothetical protein
MSFRNRTPTADRGRVTRPRIEGEHEHTMWAPAIGGYVTDGIALFRVAHGLSNRGELFLELEDCATFELVLCPARTIARLGLRAVTPA